MKKGTDAAVTGHTHAVAGAAAGACAALVFHAPVGLLPVAIALGTATALLPDVDEPGSTVNRHLPVLGPLLGRSLRHRTVTHSAVMLAVLLLLAPLMLPHAPMRWLLIGAAGYASHLACDLLTPAGIELFWPLRGRSCIGGFVLTGGWLEQAVFLPGFAAALVWAILRVVGQGRAL